MTSNSWKRTKGIEWNHNFKQMTDITQELHMKSGKLELFYKTLIEKYKQLWIKKEREGGTLNYI